MPSFILGNMFTTVDIGLCHRGTYSLISKWMLKNNTADKYTIAIVSKTVGKNIGCYERI